MTFDLLLSGNAVLPDGLLRNGWIGVVDGRVAAIGAGERPTARTTFDAGDRWILPGVVDGQTHAGSYRGLPGIESTTRSAVAGGVTTIVDMPYDNPDPLNTAERLAGKVEAVNTLAHCDVALYGTLAPGQAAADMAPLIDGGVCAFKVSAIESHPVRFPRIPADQLLDMFEYLAPTDIPLGIHNEDQEIVRARIARLKAAGSHAFRHHGESRPEPAELAATAAFLELGTSVGAHAHIVHISTDAGFRIVSRYRAEGRRATGELCVHYLVFDPDEDGAALGNKLKVSPPIRPGMREALWRDLREGRVAFVSSDHSSWPITGKLTDSVFDAGAGIPGLETLLPAFYTGAAERYGEDALAMTASFLSEAPARFFGLPRKGAIRIGADADFAVIEKGSFTWDSARAHDDLNWSPFDGRTFTVRVSDTFVRGMHLFRDGAPASKPGAGRYLPRGA